MRGSAPTGLQQRLVRDSKLSDKIFMFDLKFETWSEVVYSRQTTADRYRYILPYQNTIKCKSGRDRHSVQYSTVERELHESMLSWPSGSWGRCFLCVKRLLSLAEVDLCQNHKLKNDIVGKLHLKWLNFSDFYISSHVIPNVPIDTKIMKNTL